MFENVFVRIAYHCLSLFASLMVIFWMWLILKHSPSEMKHFKWFLLKLALMEECFTIFWGAILMPDPLFPAEGAAVLGVASYLGETGARVAMTGTGFFMMSIFISINDCVHARSLLLHGKHQLVATLVKPHIGIPLTLAIKALIGLPALVPMLLAFENPEDFIVRMKVLKKDDFIEYYASRNDTVWLCMDTAKLPTIIFLAMIVFGIVAIYLANLLSALILFRQLRSLQSHMSASSFKAHLSVLYMLTSQNIYPLIILVIPIIYTGIGFIANDSDMLASNLYKYVAAVGLLFYPMMSCFVSILIMKPYRQFLKSCLFSRKQRQTVEEAWCATRVIK